MKTSLLRFCICVAALSIGKVLQAQSWQLVIPAAHSKTITAAAFTPDGKYIVSASDDHTIKFWRAKDGSLAKTINEQVSFSQLQFDKDSGWAILASSNSWLVVNLRNFEVVYRYDNRDLQGQLYIPQTRQVLYTVGLSMNGVGKYYFYTYHIGTKERKLVATVTDSTQKYRVLSSLQLESYNSSSIIQIKNFYRDLGLLERTGSEYLWKAGTTSTAAKRDEPGIFKEFGGKKLVVNQNNNSIAVQNVKTSAVDYELGSGIYAATSISASDSLHQFWLNSTEGECKYLDVTDGQVRLITAATHKMPGYDEIFRHTKFSTNQFYEKLDSAAVGLFEIRATGITTRRIPAPRNSKILAITDDGSTIASYSNELNSLQIFDVTTNSLTKSFPLDMSRSVSATFSPDNKLLFLSGAMYFSGDSTTLEQTDCYSVDKGPNPIWKLNLLATDMHYKDGELFFYHKYTFFKTSDYKSGYYAVTAATGDFKIEQPDTYYFTTDYRSKVYPDRPATLISGGTTLAVINKNNNQTEIAKDLLPIDSKGNPEFSLLHNNEFVLYVSSGGKYSIFDLTAGKKVADLFLFNNSDDWLLVTPDGRFDGTPAATQKLYYAKMNKQIKINAVYEKFYTPNLLSRIFVREEFAVIDVNLDNFYEAPKVKIMYAQKQRNLEVTDDNPAYKNTTGIAEITVTATAPDDKVDEIRLFHNGKVVNIAARGLFVTDNDGSDSKKYTINLLPGSNNFRATALNTQRTESEPDDIIVIYAAGGSQPMPPPAPNKKDVVNISPVDKTATMYLMVIGINAYTKKINPLAYALPDATSFKEEIEKDAKSILANVKTYFITDAKANRAGIINAFNEIKKDAMPQDVFVFYYAGHGYINPSTKEFYLVSADVADAGESLLRNGIPAKELQQYAVDIKAQQQLFILDACQSAGAFDAMLQHDGEQQKSLAVVARSTGTHWMAASGSTETAKEFGELGHGAFTYVLLQALKGQAVANKMITVNGMKNFLQIQVPELVKKYGSNNQYPASYGFGNDFPVEIIK